MTAQGDNKNKGLTPELFKLDPVWFRKAFAYRMLCMLAPPPITRRLQKALFSAAVYPGTVLPPGLILPPGYTLPPGYSFPPGWRPGDPWPAGFSPPGVDWNNPSGESVDVSYFSANWQPAANRAGSLVSPAGAFRRFYEPWNTINESVWTFNYPAYPAWYADAGWLIHDDSVVTLGRELSHIIPQSLPDTLFLQIRLQAISNTRKCIFLLYTGSKKITIEFANSWDTNSVYWISGSGIGTNNANGSVNVWTLLLYPDSWKLYLGGTLKAQNDAYTLNDTNPGLISLTTENQCYQRYDYIDLARA